MNDKLFLDTNILVYAYTVSDPIKRARALAVSNQGERWISTQVLIEFVNVSHRKLKTSWPAIQTALIELLDTHLVWPTSQTTVVQATRLAQRYGFSWFDSLIVAAALDCGCQTLYSEDLQDGQLVEGSLRVVNPFRI